MPFVELQSVDSTNNYAREQIKQGLAQHGMAFFTHEQTAGKGQREKAWVSEKDANITLTILVNPHPLGIKDQFQLSACAAVAIHQLFQQYAGEDSKIKWPNDLYWQDRKAAGILIENILGTGDDPVWKWAIAGMGININQVRFPPEIQHPVSLKQITGKSHDPVILAQELCRIMNEYWEELCTRGPAKIFSLYNEYLYKKGKTVKFKKGGIVFEATIQSVTNNGKLVVKHAIEEEFNFGDVEWVI